jgi:hypothetical protein
MAIAEVGFAPLSVTENNCLIAVALRYDLAQHITDARILS